MRCCDSARTGKGERVEVSLIQAAIASLANQATNWLIGGKIPQKQGSAHPNIAPYGDVFVTSDGQELILAVGNDKQFRDLCAVLQLHETANDSRFSTNGARVSNRQMLHPLLQRKIREVGVAYLVAGLNKANIPAGIVQSVPKVFEMAEAKDLLLQISDRTGVKTYVGSQGKEMPPTFSHLPIWESIPPKYSGNPFK